MSFVIRPATAADLPRIVAIMNAQVSEPISVEDYTRRDELRPPETPYLRLVAVAADSQIAGYCVVSHESFDPPGEFGGRVRVDRAFTGQGIGTALHAQMEAFVGSQGGRRLASSVQEEEPAARRWAERLGYLVKNHCFESILALPAWDAAPFADAVERVKAGGIRFTSLAAEGGVAEAALRRLYDLSGPLHHDIPGSEADPVMPFEQWRRHVTADPEWDFQPDQVILAADGDRWVALCHLIKRPSGNWYNAFTAVDREYRGRGLSLALKVVALQYAKEQGAPAITTVNHSINASMVATNRKLGYVPQLGYFNIYKALG